MSRKSFGSFRMRQGAIEKYIRRSSCPLLTAFFIQKTSIPPSQSVNQTSIRSIYLSNPLLVTPAFNMQFTKLFAITALLAFTAVAAPAADADATRKTKPARPPPPPPPQNNNSCGNGATPYCCNTDNYGKYTSCFVLGKSTQASSLLGFHIHLSISC